ncbi:MAG: serine hydrolase [Anaerolineaceae bacterium]|nr:serine hydrolase [Anaerolineaceae bacterium]
MVVQRIEAFIEDVIKSHGLVGLGVGVVQSDQIVVERGFGFRNLKTKKPVTSKSLFHLASISKPFVATAIMQLVEQGDISLSDSPKEYLPYLNINNPFERMLTIQQMLSHTAGFTDVTDYQWDKPAYDDEALERYVRSLEINPLFIPGEKFSYSNIAYEVLGDLISKVSGLSFEDYVTNKILQPLQMQQSTHFAKAVSPDMTVSPHINDLSTMVSPLYPYHRAHSPSSTLHSNIEEMNIWAVNALNKRSLILQPVSWDLMWNPLVSTGHSDRPDKRCAHGWFLDIYKDFNLLFHSGGDVGFSTYFLMIQAHSIGITVLSNTAPAPVEAIAFGILDLLMEGETERVNPHVMGMLGQLLMDEGLESMKMKYHQLREDQAQEFDFGIKNYLDVANSLLDRGENISAETLLGFVMGLFPDNAKVYETLARSKFQMGKIPEALNCGQRSLELEPENPFLRQIIQSF